MDIIIAGAGGVGFHLAELLVQENHNITIVDLNKDLLSYVSSHLDVLTIDGDITTLDVLSKTSPSDADLFIAVTTSETTNLLSCILAKKFGAKKTIARISNIEYLSEKQQKHFSEIGVDNLISPTLLATNEITKLLHLASFTDIYEFEKGKLSVIGFTADDSCKHVGKTFAQLDKDTPTFSLKTVAILRHGKTIFPEATMTIQASDHVYFVTNAQNFQFLNNYLGKALKKISKIMIIGSTNLALETAKVLEDFYHVSLVSNDENAANSFVEKLNKTLVIHGDYNNIELLKEEGLEDMDAFLAMTPVSETNIITSLMAEQLGVYKTIAHVDNTAYTHISQNIGVDTLINKKIIAANDIFKYVRKGKIQAIASLKGVDGEIIEFEIHKDNNLTQVPLGKIPLPSDSTIVGIIRDNNGIVPKPDFLFKKGDKVIVYVSLVSIPVVENIFN